MTQKLPLSGLDHQARRQAEVINELIHEEGDWTATIRGSGTAGTYEIATQHCRYTRLCNRVILDVYIQLAGAVTGGGTSNLQITGPPYSKKADTYPQGAVRLSGVTFTANSYLTLSFMDTTESAILLIAEMVSGSVANPVGISAIGANDEIYGSICYETTGRV